MKKHKLFFTNNLFYALERSNLLSIIVSDLFHGQSYIFFLKNYVIKHIFPTHLLFFYLRKRLLILQPLLSKNKNKKINSFFSIELKTKVPALLEKIANFRPTNKTQNSTRDESFHNIRMRRSFLPVHDS